MQVLLTGAGGYIGVVVAQALAKAGHAVAGLDAGYYDDGWLYEGDVARPEVRRGDIRDLTPDDLAGHDAVVHLAELSNDPLGQLNPELTYAINHQGTVRLARLARAAGVARFVYTSSCSVYGVGTGDLMTETSPTNPQTAYAHCKVLVERDVGTLADDGFSPTFLRNATAFGASPRMRFDLVLNNLAGEAWTSGVIRMASDGTPWRPLVHVRDIARAVTCVLDAPREAVHGEIFNVGASGHNFRVREIAEVVGSVFPGAALSFGQNGGDTRSYRVSFDKIHTHLPGFRCQWDPRRGAEELREIFERIGLSRGDFEFRAYTRLRQLEHLLATGRLDDRFAWTDRVPADAAVR